MFDIRQGTNNTLILSGRFDASQVEMARGVFLSLTEGKTVTRDLGGTASTDQFTEALIKKIGG